jgi:hypothetical protein
VVDSVLGRSVATCAADEKRVAGLRRPAVFSTHSRHVAGIAPAPLNAPEMPPAMHAIESEPPSVLAGASTVDPPDIWWLSPEEQNSTQLSQMGFAGGIWLEN